MKLTRVVNVLKTIRDGLEIYADGKSEVEIAINEYDQALLDVVASSIVGTSVYGFTDSNRN
jgi:hypothetical protein